MRWFIIFGILAISLGLSHSAACVGDYCQSFCADFCYGVQNPCMSNVDILERRINACESAVTIAREDLYRSQHTFVSRSSESRSQSRLTAAANQTRIAEPLYQQRTKSFFIETEMRLNWHEALDTCRRRGNHLASPRNLDELNALNPKLCGMQRYWIDRTTTDGKCVNIQSHNGRVAMIDNTCSTPLLFICEKSSD